MANANCARSLPVCERCRRNIVGMVLTTDHNCAERKCIGAYLLADADRSGKQAKGQQSNENISDNREHDFVSVWVSTVRGR